MNDEERKDREIVEAERHAHWKSCQWPSAGLLVAFFVLNLIAADGQIINAIISTGLFAGVIFGVATVYRRIKYK